MQDDGTITGDATGEAGAQTAKGMDLHADHSTQRDFSHERDGGDHVDYVETPVGLLELTATATALCTVAFVTDRRADPHANTVTAAAAAQLRDYFAGNRQDFDLPLAPEGTEFQRRVWTQLQQVPFGCTATYRDVAVALDKPAAVRAVGAANGRNPIAVIIPCHRILGGNGQLTGYGGGLWRKEWLLRHEGALLV